MDRVARYEWHGSQFILFVLCILGITLPFAVVYFMTNLIRLESGVEDAEKLAVYLAARKA